MDSFFSMAFLFPDRAKYLISVRLGRAEGERWCKCWPSLRGALMPVAKRIRRTGSGKRRYVLKYLVAYQ